MGAKFVEASNLRTPEPAVKGVGEVTGAKHDADVCTAIALPLLAHCSRCS